MRTWILVLLGGGALYFAWTRYGSTDAAEGPASPQEAAVPDEPADVPGGGAFSSLARLRAAAEASEPAAEDPEPAAPAAVGAADDLQDLDLNALGDPLHEGALLLHRPDELQDYINGRGKGLSRTRKQLLIAYLLLARGQYGQVPKYADGLEEAEDITGEEKALLRDGIARRPVALRDGSGRPASNPLVLGASMAIVEREADEAAMASRWGHAAGRLSELLLLGLDAPWELDARTMERWATALHEAQAGHRWDRNGSWPSIEITVEPGDTLIDIRRRVLRDRPNLTLCTGLIERVNGHKGYLRPGQVLRIPTDRVRTLVDLSSRWLMYMHGDEVVCAWRVATGREGQETTPGRFQVGEKTPEPTWFPPGRIVPYGDPENPLGTRWITLENSGGLGIHGTWEPDTIGQMASDGCIRLLNRSVEELFEVIPRGSEVVLRP